MATAYRVKSNDRLSGIVSSQMGEQIALLTAAPHNLTREQAIAALTVIVAAQNDRPNINSIVEGRPIQLPTVADLNAMPGLAATLDTLDNTITPGGSLKDVVGRAAGITGLASIKASLATAPAPVVPATPDAAKSADVMTNGVEYAIAIREYTAMANRLPPDQRAGALALIDGTRNAEALTSLTPLPAGVTPAIRDVAVRVATERGAYVAALDASTAPAEITPEQAAQIADRTRTAAIASVGSGTSVGALTPENLRRGIASNINDTLATAGAPSTIGTAIDTAADAVPNEPIGRAIGTTNGNLASVARDAEASAAKAREARLDIRNATLIGERYISNSERRNAAVSESVIDLVKRNTPVMNEYVGRVAASLGLSATGTNRDGQPTYDDSVYRAAAMIFAANNGIEGAESRVTYNAGRTNEESTTRFNVPSQNDVDAASTMFKAANGIMSDGRITNGEASGRLPEALRSAVGGPAVTAR